MENEEAAQNGTSPIANTGTGELSLLTSKLAEMEITVGAFDYQNKTLEDRVSGLIDQISILKEEKQSLASQKEDLETQLGILKNEIESLKEEKTQLQSQNEEIRSQLTAEIKGLGKLLSEKEELETGIEKEKTQLQNQNESIQSQLSGLMSEKEQLLTKLENFNKEVEVLGKENAELREGISALNKFKDDTLGHLLLEKEALGTELMNMKGEFVRLKDEKGSLQGWLNGALKQVSEMEEKNASLQIQLGEIKEENVSLCGQLDDAAKNSHLEAENAILQKNMEDIGAESRRQLNALEEECCRLQEEKEKQRLEIDLLHTLKSRIEEEKDVLGKKLEGEASRRLEAVGDHPRHINDFENQLKNVSSEKKDLEDVNICLENEVKRLALAVEEQDKLKARIKEFEVNFEAVKIALETKDNTIQHLTLKLKAIQLSPEVKQKRSFIWPVVLASGSLGAAAAFGYMKFSKHH